ncbi:uncharacterized protein LOC107633029 [Arachis ipaensis]|uniref:uncharacterized protein LOC107633029 n=1 Tax=Arachis ipaensis TaxID=130454 RepID=UPI0007AFB164|nr:uncharacterized protein LOC107633029 [Arachis ipaensis]
MCINYTNLNKACPKDAFPLPNIDGLVDAALGHQYLSFMDMYSGYNQIPMHRPDEEKATPRRHTVMPFGLKNAGATYQWLVTKIFKDLLGAGACIRTTHGVSTPLAIFPRQPHHGSNGSDGEASATENGPCRTDAHLVGRVITIGDQGANPKKYGSSTLTARQTPTRGGSGIILKNENRIAIEQSIRYKFPVFNNQTEYEALIDGLALAK